MFLNTKHNLVSPTCYLGHMQCYVFYNNIIFVQFVDMDVNSGGYVCIKKFPDNELTTEIYWEYFHQTFGLLYAAIIFWMSL